MPLTLGARLGPYEILSTLGVGGMGEVYRARDPRLDRDVALKVIQGGFTEDPERQARFQREAHVLASLNHPHIGGIYGLEESDGVTALVLELVDGPTLAERIAQGPVPLDEALPIARQIAEALEAAHDQGIVHRDLKPANVKLRADGTVKVLDFGLAKLAGPPAAFAADVATAAKEGGPHIPADVGAGFSRPGMSMSPTITSPAMMTGVGIILGTAAYMAPEQARGKAVDKRADLWAYGCVLFEMLSGRRAFDGQDVTDTIAAIVRAEPDWSALPAGTPPAVRRLLKRCLAKDPKLRLREAGSAILEIDEARVAPEHGATADVEGRRRRSALVAAVALAVATVVVAGYVVWPRASTGAPFTHLVMPVSPAGALRSITSTGSIVAISDDGRQVAFIGVGAAGTQLFVRAMDQPVARAIPGSFGAVSPAFSPDGRWLAYIAGPTLFKVEAGGGAPQPVTTVGSRAVGVTWIDDEWLAFATSQSAGLMRVRAAGGEPERITTVAAGQLGHAYPTVAPGGRFLVFAVGTNSPGGLAGEAWVVPLEGGAPPRTGATSRSTSRRMAATSGCST
jgi:serine/threonine-protein kinase